MERQNKSLKFNTIIYGIRTLISLLVPLITFPYACRVLSVDAMGKVNFANSIISYFVMISILGNTQFAIRTSAVIRDDKEKMNLFASEIFSFQLVSTIFSYVLFLVMLCFTTKWKDYTVLLLIISITIPLTLAGMEWVFTVYEEYLYITLRSIAVLIASVVFLLLFVKDDSDIALYAFYTVIVSVGANILNFMRISKYVKIRLVFTKRMVTYIKPILILFASTVACQIYLYSDTTILGYLRTDREVGIYNASTRIYSLVKTVLLSISTVSMPRLAYLMGQKKKEEYTKLFQKIFNLILLLAIPCMLGVSMLAEQIVFFLAGEQYSDSVNVLKILMSTLPFALLAGLVTSGCLIIFSKEKEICIATTISAILNIVLNFIFIPSYGAYAAAFTTFLAEIVGLGIHFWNIRKVYKIEGYQKNLVQVLFAGIIMSIGVWYIKKISNILYVQLFLPMICGAVIYFTVLFIVKNEIVWNEAQAIWNKIKKNR